MTQGVKIPPEVRARAADLLRDGRSVGWTARAMGVAASSVSLIAKEAGIPLDATRTQRIVRLAREFNVARRLELINRAAEAAERLLETDLTPSQLRDVVISLAVLTDKRRLDTGEATERIEAETVHVYLPKKGSIPTIDAHIVHQGAQNLLTTTSDEAFPARGGPQTEGWQG